MKNECLESKRFRMVKERHRESFEKSCDEGKADALFIPLCEFVAGTKNYFTSSCCSGRILLLGLKGKEKSKKDSYFHFKSHEKVKFEEVWKALNEKSAGELWFKMESFILHIGTRDLKHAITVLDAMKLAGIKRGGIITAKEGKFIIELIGTQEIALPVKRGNNILIEKEFFKELVKDANEKMGKNLKQLKRMETEMKKLLK